MGFGFWGRPGDGHVANEGVWPPLQSFFSWQATKLATERCQARFHPRAFQMGPCVMETGCQFPEKQWTIVACQTGCSRGSTLRTRARKGRKNWLPRSSLKRWNRGCLMQSSFGLLVIFVFSFNNSTFAASLAEVGPCLDNSNSLYCSSLVSDAFRVCG